MKDSRFKTKEIEDKYDKFQKDISNERRFLFHINNLFSAEFKELLEDILILNENQFFIQIKNRIEAELENIYSDKIFSDQKFLSLLDKGVNSIKSDYSQNFEKFNNEYTNYTKNKNKAKFLTSGYRRHCLNEVDNEFATHTCSAKSGKFILVENNGKIEFLICSHCKKIYNRSMILCKCYKCNLEYYTEILPNNEDEFILLATWDNYHCKQINKEKIKCIKCRETFYINLKTGNLVCLNKNCNFTTKPNKILWTCSICNKDFKSGAIPYNPLDSEIIKKIIKQTLYLKQFAHPNKVPCCKVNVFYSEFYHKKKCDGILYTGELNHEVIIVCEKCHAVNYYERFIWTCPKCGNKFREDENKDNSVNEENSDISNNNTFKSSDDRKKNDKNNKEEETSSNSNAYKSKKINNNQYKNRYSKVDNNVINNYNTENNENNDDQKIIKTKSMKYKRTLNNIYYEREKEKKEKEKNNEIIESNYLTETNDNNEQSTTGQKKRSRYFSELNNINQKQNQEQPKEEKNDEQKRKIEKTPLNIFSKFRRNKRMETDIKREIKEEKEENNEQEKETKLIKIKVNKKEENLEQNKDKETDNKINIPIKSKNIIPYRSFKRNTDHNIKEVSNKLNNLYNEKKEEEEEKEKIVEPKKEKRRRYYSNLEQAIDIPKNKLTNNNNKIEEKVEIEEENLKSKKRNKVENEEKPEIKKDEINTGFKRRKLRYQEANKYLGKEFKEEGSTNPNSIKTDNNKSNKSNKSKKSNEENNISQKSNKSNEEINYSPRSNKSNEENNNPQNPEDNTDQNKDEKDNKKTNVKMSKIPGMSESLYNHVNNRINKITSKCSIPMMNVEDYTLVSKIGQGSYGTIFKAISKKDKQVFALKKIISNKLQKISDFIKEFELIYSCHHKNIMNIYSYCIRILDSSTYALYVLMELSEGDWDNEIKIRLLQNKKYTEKELVNILYQLTSSLLYIEQNFHISHRDIKPQNVLVFPGGQYKMADFGEAKEAKIMRQRNTLRGTELFMSPALYDGLKHELNDVSHNPFKSDVFSLGFCFLYASALNFNLLYQVRDILDNKNINNILHKFLDKSYSEKFIALIASMLEIDESKRYDFGDIKTYLEKNFGDMIN